MLSLPIEPYQRDEPNSFTGITTVQIFFYFKLYPSDKIGLKCLVRVKPSVHRLV